MWKKANVVALQQNRPIQEKDLMIAIKKASGVEHIGEIAIYHNPLGQGDRSAWRPLHLYFTSDGEIKKGDWGICNNTLFKCHDNDGNLINGNYFVKHAHKIIATTNADLQGGYKEGLLTSPFEGLAKIGTNFVQTYVQKQGKITEVELEYGVGGYLSTMEEDRQLKLRLNGEVIIRPPAPQVYTTEQVAQYEAYLRQIFPNTLIPGIEEVLYPEEDI
jgi:hypothetical protein